MAFALLSLYFTLTLFGCSPNKAVAPLTQYDPSTQNLPVSTTATMYRLSVQ